MQRTLPVIVESADVLVPLSLAAGPPEALVARSVEVREVVPLSARVTNLRALPRGPARVRALEAHARAVTSGEGPDLVGVSW